MLSQEVAKKYANALFLAVREKGLVEQAYQQFGDLRTLVSTDAGLVNFLLAPAVSDEDKRGLIEKVFAGRMERLFVEFLTVLVDKNRAGFLEVIADEFIRKVEAHKGLGRVTVITAVPLNDGERARLTEKMVKRTNLKIVLEEKVKPDILGGVIVILHDEIIDGSVRHGLNMIQKELTKTRVH